MKPLLTWAAAILIVLSPFSGDAGTIRTAITTTQTVTGQGDIELEGRIRNDGDVTAYNLSALLVIADIVKDFQGLGDSPPGGEIRLKDRMVQLALYPGRYEAVLRVDFEEQTGKAHHAYHFFDIPYRTEKIPGPPPPVEIKIMDPSFNRKAFWKKDAVISLSVKNNGKEKVHLNAQLFLPEGLRSPVAARTVAIPPEGTHVENIPVCLEPDATAQAPYRLIVACDHGGGHYSWGLMGAVTVVERPVYFAAYLVLALLVWMSVFAALLFRKPRAPTEG